MYYVVGFLFDPAGQRVCLIEKQHPTWQAGLWNGVGGKVHVDEGCPQAVSREFEEETGVRVPFTRWRHFATLENTDGTIVLCYTARSSKIADVKTTTDEEVAVVRVEEVPELRTLRCIRWLVPLALDDGMMVRIPSIVYTCTLTGPASVTQDEGHETEDDAPPG